MTQVTSVPTVIRPGGLGRFWTLLTTRGHRSSVTYTWPPTPADQLLQRADTFFSSGQARASQMPTARASSAVRHFDITGMQRVVSICCHGISGSLLLASFLDGHDDVLTLPAYLGCASYPFFDHYRALSLRQKLLIYPFLDEGHCNSFFRSEHSISGAEYLAAVNAACEVYGDRPGDWLESRGVFFRLLHIVFYAALGRVPASSRPLIVYAQHHRNEALASYLKEDFAEVRFIHTVRDPITNCGRVFEYSSKHGGLRGAANAIMSLTTQDAPHLNMEAKTLAVRFEDMHLRIRETMSAVANWLGLPYMPSLLESTFSGRPWTVTQGTTTWSGPRPAQAVRDSRYASFTDRCMLYAVQYEDFSQWSYPCPRIFRHAPLRILTCLLLLLVPMRIEILAARRFFRPGNVRGLSKELLRLGIGRVQIMLLLAVELYRRLTRGVALLPVCNPVGPPGRAAAHSDPASAGY